MTLNWTMPKLDTSKVPLKGDVTTHLCRRESATGHCSIMADLKLAPGTHGTFRETLPAPLASGAPHALSYFVELINARGRSAGLSNATTVPAGQAPPPLSALTAEVTRNGVALRWSPGPVEPYPTQVRLQRTLLTPAAMNGNQGPLSAPPEPAQVNLLVPADGVRGGALDKDIRFGETYEYRAQRIAHVTVDGQGLELDGELSAPVRVEARNLFPPAIPAGLAAVATPIHDGMGPSIDLSWQPDSDIDVAGYAVYRRQAGPPQAAWTRISGGEPVVGPGFHDASVRVGMTYEYAVTAIGQNGMESVKSAPTEEKVPQQ